MKPKLCRAVRKVSWHTYDGDRYEYCIDCGWRKGMGHHWNCGYTSKPIGGGL